MVAKYARVLLSGTRYNSLVPKVQGNNQTIAARAEVSDTVSFIQEIVPKTLEDTRALVETLVGEIPKEARSLSAICSKIWHFVYQHIGYCRDKTGVEQVRRPARAWRDRFSGVDCDCYSVFISSCLFNLGIPHQFRITKYEQADGSLPTWQHIYVIVPKNSNSTRLDNKSQYITMDCVKDGYDKEENYFEKRDYTMRLEFLNGLDNAKEYPTNKKQSVDANDLSGSDSEDSDIQFGKWAQLASQDWEGLSGRKKRNGPTLVGKVIRKINRVANPAVIGLRNSILLAMKVNFMNVAGRIRYAYLDKAKATQMGIDLGKLAQLRKIRDKVESIYEKAGGKKENLRKAILNGKGNKDKKVPLSGLDGLFGTSSLHGLEGDYEERQLLRADSLAALQEVEGFEQVNGLGELTVAAALAASAAVLTPLAMVLNQVKSIFNKPSPEKTAFDATAAGAAPVITETDIKESAVAIQKEEEEPEPPVPVRSIVNPPALSVPSPVIQPVVEPSIIQPNEMETTPVNTSEALLPAEEKKGFFSDLMEKAKQNPGISLLVVAGIGLAAYKMMGSDSSGSSRNSKKRKSSSGLSGIPKSKSKKGKQKKKGKSKSSNKGKPHKIKSAKLK